MKTKVLILILPSFFQIFNFSFCHSYITHMDIFHQSFRLFSESVTTSDGYRRGYVSFAHFLLYFIFKKVDLRKKNQQTTKSMQNYPVGKELIYSQAECVQASKTPMRLLLHVVSGEPLLLAYLDLS